MNVTAEEQQELAALAALGALEGADLSRWQALAKESPTARQEAQQFANTAALLALTINPQSPPPALRAKVLEGVKRAASKKSSVPAAFSFIRNAVNAHWQALPFPGVRLKELSVNREQSYAVILLEVAAGAAYAGHKHRQAEEIFVLSGDCHIEGEHLVAGDFHHAAAGTQHEVTRTDGGCILLLVVGTEDYLAH